MYNRSLLLLFLAPVAACMSPYQGARAQTSTATPFSAPGQTMLPTGSADIPLTKSGPFYYVDVKLNGLPFRFTLETGAGFFAISKRAAHALGVKIDSVELMPGSRAAVATIDSLTMPGVTFRNLSALINPWDGGDFDGIISIPVLHDVLATIDLRASRLRLTKGTLPVANGRDVLPILGRDRGGRIDVEMDFGGEAVLVVLDSRSFISIVVPDSLEPALKLSDSPRPIGGARGPSLGSFNLRGAHMASDLRVGAINVERPAITFRNRPGAIVGVAFLELFAVTIDQVNHRVRFAHQGGNTAVIPRQDWEMGSSVGGVPTAVVAGPVPTGRPMGFNLTGSPRGDLLVVNLVPGSNAEKAGIRNDDHVVEFDGTPAASMSPEIFRRAVARATPVKIVVVRDNKRLEFMVTPQSANGER